MGVKEPKNAYETAYFIRHALAQCGYVAGKITIELSPPNFSNLLDHTHSHLLDPRDNANIDDAIVVDGLMFRFVR